MRKTFEVVDMFCGAGGEGSRAGRNERVKGFGRI